MTMKNHCYKYSALNARYSVLLNVSYIPLTTWRYLSSRNVSAKVLKKGSWVKTVRIILWKNHCLNKRYIFDKTATYLLHLMWTYTKQLNLHQSRIITLPHRSNEKQKVQGTKQYGVLIFRWDLDSFILILK